MEAGIVGLPNVGKSTLFNALTAAGIASENYPVLHDRAERRRRRRARSAAGTDQRASSRRRRSSPRCCKLVDIAGIVRGAREGEGLGNKFLSHIREVDAILHVVRCFEDGDVIHVEGSVDPIRDIETIDTELMLADLQSVETMLDRAKRTARTGDKEAEAARRDSRRVQRPARRRQAGARAGLRRRSAGQGAWPSCSCSPPSRCSTSPTSTRTTSTARARS